MMTTASQRPPHIMIVEDDIASRSLLVSYFRKEGYRISESGRADDLMQRVEREGIDLILLDINLPGKDGLTLTRELRAASRVGIILVTSKGDEIDRIVGLELGADDYVTKPFNPRELLVRAKNLLWRVSESRQAGHQTAANGTWHFNGWTLDAHKRHLLGPQGQCERLPQGEFKLLHTLVTRAGQVLSRDQLMDAIHDREWTPNDRSIDVLVGRLRRKLNDNPSAPELILTAHGAGYVFAATVDTGNG
ncbi:MAG TPA: response regulator [Rhodocyclaceae bacterium]|nr:response regulator [Rhodocyclaceae bacterium]HRQ46641.1 response regulator [Rhodocyclaceae bacterium]